MSENKIYDIAVLRCQKANFKNDKGEDIKYMSYFVDIGSERIGVYPNKDKKALFNYLVKQEIENLENELPY